MKYIFYILIVLIGFNCQIPREIDSIPTSNRHIDDDQHIKSFYKDVLHAVSHPQADSLLSTYDTLLITQNYLTQINGDSLNNLFQKMYEKEEIFLPTYGRASNCPYDLHGFVKTIRKYTDNIESIDKSHPLHKILEEHKSIEEGNDLGPKLIAQFFLNSFSKELWENDKYRKVGYMFFFLYTTIDDVGMKKNLEKLLEELKKN